MNEEKVIIQYEMSVIDKLKGIYSIFFPLANTHAGILIQAVINSYRNLDLNLLKKKCRALPLPSAISKKIRDLEWDEIAILIEDLQYLIEESSKMSEYRSGDLNLQITNLIITSWIEKIRAHYDESKQRETLH